MAKKKLAINQIKKQEFPSYPEVGEMMEMETASILSDYLVQVIGDVNSNSVIINQDRVAKTQSYKELIQFELYAEVAHDPHVSSVVNTLRIMIASLEWEIKPFSESARDKAIAKFVRDNFEGLDNFSQDLYELNDAIFMGVAWSEIIYKVEKEVKLQKLMNRPQRRLQFDGVTREPKLRSKENPFYGTALPENKFIIHRAASTHENPFGDALAQNVYWLWVFKRVVLKFWASHLEVGVAPVPIVKHPAGKNSTYKAEALDIAKQIRNGAYGRIPDNMEVLWAEAKNMAAAGMSYKDFEEFCNSEITKAILGQLLTTEGSSSGGTGSRALGDVHMQVLQSRIIFYANALACTLNSTAVKWVVDYNYASVDGYPKFTFVTKQAVDRKTEAEIIKILKDSGFTVKHTYIEDVLKIPIQEMEEKQPDVPDLSNKKIDENGNLITNPKTKIEEKDNAKE